MTASTTRTRYPTHTASHTAAPNTHTLAAKLGAGLCAGLCAAVQAQAPVRVAVYDPETRLVTLPSVKVGADTYTRVSLLNVGDYTFTLQGATAQLPPGPGAAEYDPATNLLRIPAVRVGGTTYTDVSLLNIGNYTFTLQAATELPAATLDAVRGLLNRLDALWATEVPRSGETRLSLSDGCWRNEGRTRANAVAETDEDPALAAQRDAYRVGSLSSNVQVLAVRQIVNPDGSRRQEIDVQYDVAYRDGSTALGTQWTLISGSSTGTPGCSTPQASDTLRFLGNQQLVSVGVRARNVRDERHSATTGAVLSPAVNHRRVLQWNVSDPMGNASYVVVSGPGPAATVGGASVPFSLKLISPRLLRSAPELVGKPGNFLNWLDDDAWRYCRAAGSGTPVASIADCTGLGATAFESGVTTATPNAAADQSFVNQGWVEGGVYRFDVYNDDGWKTVNGQAGKTPIATYYNTLDRLPYPFVEMADNGAGGDRYPHLSFGALSFAQVQANAVAATPAAMNVSWTLPAALSDGRRFGLSTAYEFHQGARLGNAPGVLNPGYRWTFNSYPASTATALPAWAVTARPADQLSKSYFEFTLLYTDRTERQLLSTVSFQ